MTIGDGAPLWVIAGLNVLEDLDLARAVAAHLRGVCAELHLPFVFKASFDKANRSSIRSYRGPGLEAGLAQLAAIRAEFGVPICTDYHEA
ncbi:MAG TPA: 3-deoxy-8-phosphooctulonate synthase, partial [Hyphomonadaceae bacterium]|nr:3-deoxy-8-phosphooctulonate synthase [Hyphomonadaceae bacterium]